MDYLLAAFSHLTPAFRQKSVDQMQLEEAEKAIVKELAAGWGKTKTVELLKGLSEKYGQAAPKAVGKFIAESTKEDWAATGEREAHEGTEITDFIRLLWEPLAEQGFVYTSETKGTEVAFHVTKCPLFDLAEMTGLHDWLYQLACSTDFYMASSFSPKINFTRTKTLMEGCDYCNHCYNYKR
jgi:predicted ArsR family transcriptional regulator